MIGSNIWGSRLWSLSDMEEILARGMVEVSAHLERLVVLFSEWESPGAAAYSPKNPVSVGSRRSVVSTYGSIADAADIMGVPLTGVAAKRARKRLLQRKQTVTYGELKDMNAEVKSRFADEIATVSFYCLGRGAAAYYSPDGPLFGSLVDARIPGAANDISEGGKCFAVGRYTASIFHLMRAMEAAVQEMSADLGIGNPERVWGQLLSDIHAKIEAMPKGDARNNWSQVHANLYHVKQAWRNETMHPKATYTEEEAPSRRMLTMASSQHLPRLAPTTPLKAFSKSFGSSLAPAALASSMKRFDSSGSSHLD